MAQRNGCDDGRFCLELVGNGGKGDQRTAEEGEREDDNWQYHSRDLQEQEELWTRARHVGHDV